jgi:uncharacterized repeat protein (TIGR01451 family)
LGTNQNDATSPVPGSAVYNPTNGVVLPVGTNTLTVVYTPTDTNYASTNLSVHLVVTPAPRTVTATNASKTYGQANPPLGGTVTGIENGDNITATYATTATTGSPAGAYPITPTLLDPSGRLVNYTVVTNIGTLTVNKAVLGISANSTNRIYGTANPVFTYTPSGFVNGDTASVLSGSPSLTTPAVTNSPAGTYPIVATNGTLTAANYSFSFTNGTLTVNGGVPTALGQSLPTLENTATVITLTGSDPANQPLTFMIVSAPTNGGLTLLNTNTGAVTYTPATNYAGADSFTFRVSNGQTNSPPATVNITVTPTADLAVTQTGPATGFIGSNLVYTVNVTNLGPATATGLIISNLLAPGLTFVSASGSGTNTGSLVTWFVPSLPSDGVTNFTVTVFAAGGGTFTNIVSGSSAVFDPNPANNDGSLANSQVQTLIVSPGQPAQFGLLVGQTVLNPATGLFEQSVVVTNIGSTTVLGVQLRVVELPLGITLYNEAGTTNGLPYVQYNSPLNTNATVTFALEFFNATNRLPFSDAFTAVAIMPTNVTTSGNGVLINTIFMDTNSIPGETRMGIEFQTTPGTTYTVLYSSNLAASATWNVATPSITAGATITIWYDDGPPKTDSKPMSVPMRYYRVIAN